MKSKDLSSLPGALLALVLAGSNLGCGGSGPPPVVATQLAVSVSAANATAGTAMNVTVRAVDASGALATTYAGTVHFTSSDTQAALPADSALTSGTGTFSVTFKTAGSQTVSVDDKATASIAGISAVVAVNPGAAMQLTLTAASPETRGFSFTLSVNATDAYGNAATGYTGTVHFTSSDAQATLPTNAPLPNGSGSFPGVTLKTIGSQTITATDTVTASLKGTTSAVNVVSNAATHLSVSGPANTQARATFKLTVSALDAANNVSAAYSGTVHFTSSDAQAMLPADSTLAAGTAQFSATLEASGTQTLTATDTASASINGSSSISVAATAPLTLNLNCTYTPGGCTSTTTPPNGVVGNLYYPHVVTHCISLFHCFRATVYGFPLAVTGGVPPFNWSWAAAAGSSLPPGLNVSNSPNQISGTPTQAGTYNIVLTVADLGLPPAQASQNYSITVTLPPPPVVNTAQSQISAVLNQPLSYTFTATGNSLQQPFTWSETGALPAGLAFASSGTLSGTPTQTGSSQISVTATDQFKQTSAVANFTIVVTTHGFLLTGSMATPRRFHTATLLPNGKVLVAGGQNAGYAPVTSAELFDPSTGTFSATGNMTVPRAGHTATLLNNGKVLIAGGNSDASGAAVSSAELYDPSTGAFTATPGSMTAARVSHTATLLQSGKVLIAGGDVLFYNASGQSLASAETFDPSTETFTATNSMTVPRESHTATLLSGGKVLITGGSDGTLGYTATTTLYASSETFDPSTGQFTAAGMMTTQRLWQTASLLASGRVLVAGGDSVSRTEATADFFDPTSGSFAATGNMTEPRFYHAASTLNDGTVLISGGLQNGENAKATAEIYDPTAGTFAATGSMNAARIWHTSTVLPNGKVLITGGADPPLATAELYQ
jgi:hypothetical protein